MTFNPLRLFLPIFLLSIFALVVWEVNSPRLLQTFYLDPFIYAGYIHDFRNTADRFGAHYFSERLSYVLLEMTFAKSFGIEAGYRLARLVALFAAGWSVFMLVRKFFGPLTAIFAVSWTVFCPWLLRSLSWTHYDGIGTVYVICAIALLTVPKKRGIATHFFAGFLFFLAVNCNIFVVAVGAAFAVPWLILNGRESAVWLFKRAISIAIGFISAYLLMAYIYSELMPGNPILLHASLAKAKALTLGDGAVFKTSFSYAIRTNPHILILPVSLLLISAGLLADGKPLGRRSELFAFLLFGLIIFTFYFVHVLFLNGASFSYFYYTIYLWPASSLLIFSLVGRLEECGTQESKTCVIGFSILPLLIFVAIPLVENNFSNSLTWGTLVAFILFLAPRLRSNGIRSHSFRGLAASLAVVMAIITMGLTKNFEDFSHRPDGSIHNDQKYGWALYKAAIEFQKWVNDQVPASDSLVFWYPQEDGDAALESIQSVFLHGWSRIGGSDESRFPEIDESMRERLKTSRFLVILTSSLTDRTAGIQQVRDSALGFKVKNHFAFKHAGLIFFATLLENVDE